MNAEARNAAIGRSQVQTFQPDPMEGLPDPGNPAILQLDTLLPEEETSKVNMQLQIEPEWAELWKLFKPWHFELIIDIPREAMPVPLALQYLSGCKIGIQNCQKLHLFTDGSFNPGAEVASFAIVIVGSNPDSKNRYFGGWFGGILQLDATNPNYTGARQASASEAEISALLWAHLWLIQQNFQGHVDICYDSLVAGHGAAGRWKCDASWTQLCKLREVSQLYNKMKVKGTTDYLHVKAHSGQPQNELADALAKYLATSAKAHQGDFLPKIDWRPLFHQDHKLLEWAWWIYEGLSGSCTQPRFAEGNCQWDFFATKPQIKNLERDISQAGASVTFSIRVGTFNVLSLLRKHSDGEDVETSRAALLRSQLLDGGYHAIGLQETRSNCNTIFQSADFLRIVSGDVQGHHGVELWLNRRLPFAKDAESAHYVELSRVTVLHYDTRQLFVKLQVGGTHLVFAVLHAPHEKTALDIKKEWWQDMEKKLARFRKQGKCILMGDFNARISGQDGIHVGDLVEDFGNENGDFLEATLTDHALWLPSTFSTLHSGRSRTWIHPKGPTARLDYVALDLCFQGCASDSLVDETIQVPNNARDHLLVGLFLGWTEEQFHSKTLQKPTYDWAAMRTEEGRRKLDNLIQSLPDVGWDVDAHTHWQVLEDSLHDKLAAAFPVKKRPSRSDIFSSTTWTLLEHRRRLRGHLDYCDLLCQQTSILAALRAWADGTALVEVWNVERLRTLGLLCLQRALLCSFRSVSKKVRKSAAEDKATYVAGIGDYMNGASNADLFKALRQLRIGSTFRKRSLLPLPHLQDENNGVALSWEDRDERWRQHCSKMEAGIDTNTSDLVDRAIQGALKRASAHPVHTLQDVPTLRELEDAFRRVKPNKAAGLDNLRSDLCGLAPAALAEKFFSLLAKLTLNYSEPIQMKGGVLVAAFKSGSPYSIEQYRSLLLSSHIGKSLRRTLRQRLTGLYSTTAPSLHVSVKAGGNVSHASQALRSYIEACRAQKRSVAILFLDIKSAYYRVVRQLAAKATNCAQDVERILATFDLGPTDLAALKEELSQSSALQQAGSDAHTELYVEELLQSTWFVTSERRTLTESLAGTRPGDGLADVIFSFVFKKVMEQVTTRLKEHFGWSDFEPITNFDITNRPERVPSLPPMVEVVWADDLALAVSDPDANRVVGIMQEAARQTFVACIRHGMQPNLSKNKTEIMLILRGEKSRQLKRDLFSCDPPVLTLSGLPDDFATVRLTGGYKHLGHRLLLGDSIFAEVRSRTGQAAAVFRQYRRQVFQNGRVPLEKRKYLFGSLVLSILRFNLGTWPSLTDRCYAYFRKKVFALYRGLARATVPEPELRLWNNNKVLEFLAMPDPQIILYEAQLRYSVSLLKHGPEVLVHLLLAEEGWLDTLRTAVEWMNQQLRGYGPNFYPDWNYIFRMQPSAAKSWISKAVRHDTIQRSIHTQWTEWHHDFLSECQATGLEISFPWTQLSSLDRPNPHGAAEACLACGKLFRSKAAWAVHAFRKHNRVNWRRHYISGSRCEACLKDYGTTERLLNHLTYSTSCANRLKTNLDQVPLRPGKKRSQLRQTTSSTWS